MGMGMLVIAIMIKPMQSVMEITLEETTTTIE